MRRTVILGIALTVTSAVVLGSTVFRQQVADAANLVNVFVTNDSSHPVPVREQNLDTNGNIKVHEQGTANVSVTNSSLPVALPPVTGGGDSASIQAGDSATYSQPVVASGLTMVLTAEVDEVIFFYQNSPVAFITGPSGTSESLPSTTVYMPLTRPIEFDRIDCFANGNPGLCKIGWVGNMP